MNEKSAGKKEKFKRATNSNWIENEQKNLKRGRINARFFYKSELCLLLLDERFGLLVDFWHQDFVDNVDDTVRVHQIRFDYRGFLHL